MGNARSPATGALEQISDNGSKSRQLQQRCAAANPYNVSKRPVRRAPFGHFLCEAPIALLNIMEAICAGNRSILPHLLHVPCVEARSIPDGRHCSSEKRQASVQRRDVVMLCWLRGSRRERGCKDLRRCYLLDFPCGPQRLLRSIAVLPKLATYLAPAKLCCYELRQTGT